MISKGTAQSLQEELAKVEQTLVPISENLVDEAWGDERPAPPSNKVFVQPESYAGKSHLEKINEVRKQLQEEKAHALVVSALDEIACKSPVLLQ